MNAARWSAALYVALAAHAIAVLTLAVVPPPQQGPGTALGLSRHPVGLDARDLAAMLPPATLSVPPPTSASSPVSWSESAAAPASARVLQRQVPPRLQADASADASAGAGVPSPPPQGEVEERLPLPEVLPQAASGGGGRDSYPWRLRAHLAAHRRPLDLHGQATAIAEVEIEVGAGGRLLAVSLRRSSGLAALDREALALLRRAEPLPPPSEGRSVRLLVPIRIEPDPG